MIWCTKKETYAPHQYQYECFSTSLSSLSIQLVQRRTTPSCARISSLKLIHANSHFHLSWSLSSYIMYTGIFIPTIYRQAWKQTGANHGPRLMLVHIDVDGSWKNWANPFFGSLPSSRLNHCTGLPKQIAAKMDEAHNSSDLQQC